MAPGGAAAGAPRAAACRAGLPAITDTVALRSGAVH
jgi:hypothetical protein